MKCCLCIGADADFHYKGSGEYTNVAFVMCWKCAMEKGLLDDVATDPPENAG